MEQLRQIRILGGAVLIALTLVHAGRVQSQSAVDQLRQIGGSWQNVPEVGPPTRDEQGTEQSWDISHPGWRTWNKESQQRAARAKPATNHARSDPMPSHDSLEEQKKRQGQQRQAQLEQFWQQVQAQQVQQQSQQAQQQKIFEQTKKDLLANFRVPDSQVESGHFDDSEDLVRDGVENRYLESAPCFGAVPIVTLGISGGLTPQQWQQARQYQELINTLQHSPEMTPLDEAILEMAELRRAVLWKKAVSVPGLPDDAREALALKLPVTESKFPVLRLRRQDIEEIQTSAIPAPDHSGKIASTLLDCINGLPTAQSADPSLVAETGTRFGDFLGLYKIAMATSEGDISTGLSNAVDFVVGKIPFPQATLAVEGGRIYSRVAFQATNQFMTDAMTAAGGTFDADAFWNDFKNDLNVWQRAVMEFVDYGPKE
jgi:hypothetical protein